MLTLYSYTDTYMYEVVSISILIFGQTIAYSLRSVRVSREVIPGYYRMGIEFMISNHAGKMAPNVPLSCVRKNLQAMRMTLSWPIPYEVINVLILVLLSLYYSHYTSIQY